MLLGSISWTYIPMNISYAIVPFLAWLAAGTLKFIINSIKAKKFAFSLIGYGGLPSNHSAIVSSITTLIALKEGINHPAFGVSLALSFIVILDASSLRRQVGKHAVLLNTLRKDTDTHHRLRERIGHTHLEIISGIIVGILIAIAVNMTSLYLQSY